jgi:sirohydrochlorin ferrochelatase
MDTDDLTEMAWGIIVSASHVSDTLKAELGAMASRFKTEDEWLRGVRAHLVEILADPAEYVDSWDLENEEVVTATMIGSFAAKIHDRVDTVLSTLMNKRGSRVMDTDRKSKPPCTSRLARGRRLAGVG